jgi:hypothetical protein
MQFMIRAAVTARTVITAARRHDARIVDLEIETLETT